MRVAAERDAVGYQGGGDFGEGGVEGGFVDEESLDCVAGGRVGGLGIEKKRDGHGDRGGFVQVDGTEAVGVAEHGDTRLILDRAHEFVAAAWDHEVDVAVLIEEFYGAGTGGE